MMDLCTVIRLLTRDLLLLELSRNNKRQEFGHGTSSIQPQYETIAFCTVEHIYSPPHM